MRREPSLVVGADGSLQRQDDLSLGNDDAVILRHREAAGGGEQEGECGDQAFEHRDSGQRAHLHSSVVQ
jgi:hypothetical protein